MTGDELADSLSVTVVRGRPGDRLAVTMAQSPGDTERLPQCMIQRQTRRYSTEVSVDTEGLQVFLSIIGVTSRTVSIIGVRE